MAPHEWRFNLPALVFLLLHVSQLPHQPPSGVFLVTPADTQPFNTESPVDEFAEQPRPPPEPLSFYLVFGGNQMPHLGRFNHFPLTG